MNHSTAPVRFARSARAGSILLGVIVMLVILQLAVAGIVLGGGRETDLSRTRWGDARAFYNAESAGAMSLEELAQNTDVDSDGKIGGISDDGLPNNGPQLNGGRLMAAYAGGSSGTIAAAGAAISSSRAPAMTVVRTLKDPGRPGLYFESWGLLGHILSSLLNWNLPPTATGWVHNISWPSQSSSNMMYVGQGYAAARFTGKIETDTAGLYGFAVDVNEDARLLINGVQVLNAGSTSGGCRRVTGSINLSAGLHDFEVRYTDGGSTGCLVALWQKPGDTGFTVIPPAAFHWYPSDRQPGLVASASISFTGNGSTSTSTGTAGWNANQGPYSAALQIAGEGSIVTNSTALGVLTASAGANIRGDVSIGVGGLPLLSILFSGGSILGGLGSALPVKAANVVHPLPTALPSSTGPLSLTGAATLTIDSDRTYDSLTLAGSSVMSVTGDRTVYVTGNVSLANAAQISVPSGSVLRLYVDGGVTLSGTAQLNSSMLPQRCFIYMRGSSKTLGLSGSAQLHAHVRAPYCSTVMSADAVLSGTLGTGSLQASAQAQLRLDCGPVYSAPPSTSYELRITSYTEP